MYHTMPEEYKPAVYRLEVSTEQELDKLESKIAELRAELKAARANALAFSIGLLARCVELSAKEHKDYISGAVNALDESRDGKFRFPETRKCFARILPIVSSVYVAYNGNITAFASRETYHNEATLMRLADDLRTAKAVKFEKGYLAEYKKGNALPYLTEGDVRFKPEKVILLEQRKKEAENHAKQWRKALKSAKDDAERNNLTAAIEQAEKEIAAVSNALAAIA